MSLTPPYEPKCKVYTTRTGEREVFYSTIDYEVAKERWRVARALNGIVELDRLAKGMFDPPSPITLDNSEIRIIEPYE